MAQAAQQQSTGIEEVNTAVTQMDQVTQQNAAMVEQSTAASRNLANETADLSKMVAYFDVGVVALETRTPAVPPGPKVVPRAVPKMQARVVASFGGRRAAAAEENWKEF